MAVMNFLQRVWRSWVNRRTTANTRLWRRVCVTNPETVRTAEKHGRRFTAICAQAQRLKATEVFGPYGKGWGLTPHDCKFTLLTKDLILFQGIFFYTYRGKKYHFPIATSISPKIATANGAYLDDECIKKLMTDAETKALSKLGFNADVFLGLFDDNRYLDYLKQEFLEEAPNPTLENLKQLYRRKLQAMKAGGDLPTDVYRRLSRRLAGVRTPQELAALRSELQSTAAVNGGKHPPEADSRIETADA